MKRHSGFTLIEVMIVVAVSTILLGAVFAINFRITDAWRSERVRQALQQNFRFVADMMTVDLRQATLAPGVSLPARNTLSDVLRFQYVTAPSPDEARSEVTYALVKTGSLSHIERLEVPLEDPNGDGVWTQVGGTFTPVLVTEDISSLAALHFIGRGSSIVIILVADYESGGARHTVSYTLQASTRT